MDYKKLLILLFAFFLIGCGQLSHCFTLGADIDGIEGELTWCFSPAQSAKEGRPVFIRQDGEKLIGFPELDVKTILELIKNAGSKIWEMLVTKIAPESETISTDTQRLIKKIELWRKRHEKPKKPK